MLDAQAPETGTLLETADAARLIGVSPQWVRILDLKGDLTPRFKTPRGCRLFAPEDVMRVRAEREARRR